MPYVRLRVLSALALAISALTAASDPLPEYAVKAAFLYNFFKFVEWPASNEGGTFELCLMGEDPFGGALSSIEGKQARQRPLRINRIAGVGQARSCHMLFISEQAENRLGVLLRQLEDAPILTVGDAEGFVAAGGMIGLVMVDDRVQLEINLRAVEKAGLKISSQLLKLAHVK